MTMPAEAFINMTGIAYMAQTQNAIQVTQTDCQLCAQREHPNNTSHPSLPL
jgi:hypothetical protein